MARIANRDDRDGSECEERSFKSIWRLQRKKMIFESSLELNTPTSFESESYTCAKLESYGVISVKPNIFALIIFN